MILQNLIPWIKLIKFEGLNKCGIIAVLPTHKIQKRKLKEEKCPKQNTKETGYKRTMNMLIIQEIRNRHGHHHEQAPNQNEH